MQLTIEAPSIQTLQTIALAVGGYFCLRLSLRFYFKYKRNQKRKSYPKDVVILHQFPSSKTKPSLSVPCLKLETWLRVSGLKYQSEYSYLDRSTQGQLPYITLNESEYHDSQFIIEHLSKKFDKPLTLSLSKTDQAIARGFFKLLEESFKWSMYYHRFMFGKASDIGMPYLIFKLLKPRLRKAISIQGYGRHSAEEVYHIGQQDLQALEDFLNGKKYLFGDNICNEDVVLFCFVAQLVYYDNGPLRQFLVRYCPGLLRHFKTIKNEYWNEWSDVEL
ncbi:failed axon connections -like protein [Brachionus plicatilis]|uniref:Failed axon connections-like protein n=1 Tax=Brachionus plicatilis TaxID=10195 RepID=A0A3M7R146_BRAPC|nr:failed axon connections -like protein [Brachionus plicatilis]